MERINRSEQYSNDGLWQAVENAWPGTLVRNKDNPLNQTVNVCVIYCPLYAQGTLEESSLITPPSTIEDSRVVRKMQAYMSTITAMASHLRSYGRNLELTAVFANKGVLTANEPSAADKETLQYHRYLYEEFTRKIATQHAFDYSFFDYDELNIAFPRFVSLTDPVPELTHETGLPEGVVANRKNRKVAQKIGEMNSLGKSGAYWLIAGYLAFDHKIPELVGDNGVCVVAERFPPLFGIANMTESLKKMTSVRLIA